LPPAFAEFRPRFENAMDDDQHAAGARRALRFRLRLADARDRGTGTSGAFVAGVDELVQLSRVLGLFGHGAALDGRRRKSSSCHRAGRGAGPP
jgi:hypothetical protein